MAYTTDAIQKCNTDRACKTFGSKSPKVNSTKRIYLKFGPCHDIMISFRYFSPIPSVFLDVK